MEEKGGDYGAFMEKFELKGSTSSHLPLHGLTFAVKDIFDMEGFITGFGNPDWARTHAPAKSTSPVVLATLHAGATCLGRTVMDEMAYSINGENKHYGTPTNLCAPDRVPGGSSSGSAVAVAGKLVDFSLGTVAYSKQISSLILELKAAITGVNIVPLKIGTDTGGSIRVPAAYCGIFGFRPSHGIISTEKVIPMAQSFDTVGWFARDLQTLIQAGQVLLKLPPETRNQPTRISIPRDCFETLGLPSDKTYQIMNASTKKVYSSELIDNEDLDGYIYKNVPSMQKFISNYQGKGVASPALAAISHAMRLIQRSEFKANHEEWINATKPNFGPGIKERICEALTANYNDLALCSAIRDELKSALGNFVGNYGLLAIPTVPGPPPKLLMDASALENFRAKAFSLLSIAGMTGFCQINIPLGLHNNLPVSISLLANHGSDMFLLNVAQELYTTLKEQASIAWA